MGALPHMAVLAGERPILVATPWVLVPKGVQVHRPPGNGHRDSHDRPTDRLPVAPWRRRHIWPTRHAWSPATRPRSDQHSGSVVERPLCDREVAGSIPGGVIPKTLKMVLAALSLGAQH